MIITNPNNWTLEELEIMHKVMGAEFELNNGKITKYEIKIGE